MQLFFVTMSPLFAVISNISSFSLSSITVSSIAPVYSIPFSSIALSSKIQWQSLLYWKWFDVMKISLKPDSTSTTIIIAVNCCFFFFHIYVPLHRKHEHSFPLRFLLSFVLALRFVYRWRSFPHHLFLFDFFVVLIQIFRCWYYLPSVTRSSLRTSFWFFLCRWR